MMDLCYRMRLIFSFCLQKVESKLLQPQQQKIVDSVEKEVEDHFLKIIARIQLLENRIRLELNQELSKGKRRLEAIYEELQYDYKTITEIINGISLSDNPKFIATMNIKQLLKDFERVAANSKPHLVEEVGHSSAKFLVDDGFLNEIDGHCSLECTIENGYYLAADGELPDGYVTESVSGRTSRSENLNCKYSLRKCSQQNFQKHSCIVSI